KDPVMKSKPPDETAISAAEAPEAGGPGAPPEGVPPGPQASEEATASARQKFPVVGIGASAGGLEALEALARRLTTDGMAFVVLQHLAPGPHSVLAEILRRCTPIKVSTIEDGVTVAPNVVYVAPPKVEV